LGAMMSAFFVCRSILGLDPFVRYVSRNTSCTAIS
jgi:hypothetical protein